MSSSKPWAAGEPAEPRTPTTPPAAGTDPGPSPPVSPAFLMMAVGRSVRAEVEADLQGWNLALRHVSALGHLTAEPGLSYSELGRRSGVSAQSMQVTLTELEGRGAVQREGEPGRGRTAKLHVTEAGAQLLDQARRVMDAADERLLGAVADQDRRAFVHALYAAFTAAQPRAGGDHAVPQTVDARTGLGRAATGSSPCD